MRHGVGWLGLVVAAGLAMSAPSVAQAAFLVDFDRGACGQVGPKGGPPGGTEEIDLYSLNRVPVDAPWTFKLARIGVANECNGYADIGLRSNTPPEAVWILVDPRTTATVNKASLKNLGLY